MSFHAGATTRLQVFAGVAATVDHARQVRGFRLLLPLLIWLLINHETSVWGQDLGEVEIQPAVVDPFAFNDANFNQWVFGNVRMDLSPEERLKSFLILQTAEVERACTLSDAQRQKLLLAGSGDIKRFANRVADAKLVFDRLKHDQNNIGEMFQSAQPLAASLAAGLFGEGSFYSKTLRTTLRPEQLTSYREMIQEKNRFRYKAKVSLALANLDASVGFTTDQLHRFAAVILKETTPTEKPAPQQEVNVVLCKIARLPESKIRPIFDDVQWNSLSQRLHQARQMEPELRALGLLDPIEPAKAEQPTTKND